jgi:hypothetical protein
MGSRDKPPFGSSTGEKNHSKPAEQDDARSERDTRAVKEHLRRVLEQPNPKLKEAGGSSEEQ